jgi:hypothetical protein
LQTQLEAKTPQVLIDAQVREIEARIKKIENEAVNKSVESLYSATQAAGAVAMNPNVSSIADAMLHSSGFIDRDSAPIIPEGVEQMPVDMPMNNNPMTPANPAVGMGEGIETPEDAVLTALKKRRLELKDEIAAMLHSAEA